MSLLHLFIVAAIQGLTEFLPVSSSGHLVLLPALTGLRDQGLALDVAVHLGSLFAVILFFRAEVRIVIGGLGRLAKGRVDTAGAFLALCLGLSAIPVILVGAVMKLSGAEEALRSVAVIGWTMLGFGILLYFADKTGKRERTSERWTIRDAVLMGLAQTLALIPGTSRSGITITAARGLGYDRESAARLSMLMSIPVIIASGTMLGTDVIGDANWQTARDGAIAAIFAFATAWMALALMMRLLRSVSFTPYVIYRVIIGIVLLTIAYGPSGTHVLG